MGTRGRGATERHASRRRTPAGPGRPAETDSPDGERAGCPDCGGRVRRTDWEFVCDDCGLVVGDARLSRGPEWRHDEGGRRCNGRPAAASTNPGWGRTAIGTDRERREASTAAVAFGRLAGLQARSVDYDARLLNHALPEVKRVCGALDLRGDTVERACGLFRRARTTGFLERRCVETVAGAAVYAACREHRAARLPADVAAVLRLTAEDLPGSTDPVDAMLRAYRRMREAGDIPIAAYPPTAPEFVPRFASSLDVPGETRRRARTIAVRACRSGSAGSRRPSCVAGAALALAAATTGEAVGDADVAAVADVSVETLRDARRALEDAPAVERIEAADQAPG